MNYIWDTNILLHYLGESTSFQKWNDQFKFFSPKNRTALAIITVGEVYSLAIQRKWGRKKLQHLEKTIATFHTFVISKKAVIQAYATIDAFRQGRHPDYKASFSARNMGKNDLWIAATAHVSNGVLVTTDQDFSHLANKFIDLELLKLDA